MTETWTWLSATGFGLGVLALLAGIGFGRFVVALVVAVLVSGLAGSGIGWVAFRIALAFDRGGEWRGLGALVIGGFTGVAVFVGTLGLTLVLLAFSRWSIYRRSRPSRWLLGMSGVLFLAGFSAAAFNTPGNTSTARLVKLVAESGGHPAAEAELLHRGPEARAAVLAETSHSPLIKERPGPSIAGDFLEQVTRERALQSFLRLLGQFGDAEAQAELRRWAGSRASRDLRIEAVVALSNCGDRAAIPWIVALLPLTPNDGSQRNVSLLSALGRLKAEEQIGTLRDAITAPSQLPKWQVVHAGVAALAAIDTDESWQTIADLSAAPDVELRRSVIDALRNVSMPRRVAILAVALDDRDDQVKEQAFWILLQADRRLGNAVPHEWNPANAGKMSDAIRSLGL